MDIPREWTFENTKVASGFDRHVREQLPWYDFGHWCGGAHRPSLHPQKWVGV